jgi:trigger factor
MSFSLKGDQRWQQRLQGAAVVATTKLKELPAAVVPPLSSLDVVVDLTPTDAVDLGSAMINVLWEHGERRNLEPDEEIEAGDEIRVSCAGYLEGKLVPFTPRYDAWLRVSDDEFLGLTEQLTGATVGDNGAHAVVLGPGFPAESLRGKEILLAVQILEARRITLPNGDDPAVWQRLGYGATLEQAAHKMAAELAEQMQSMAALHTARTAMLALGRAATVEIPASLVEEEVTRRWKATEGETLVSLGLGIDEQNESLRAWKGLQEVRELATDSLRTAAAVKALIEADDIRVTAENILPVIESFPDVDAAFAERLAKDPDVWKELEPQALQALIVEYVLQHVNVRVTGG